MIPVEKIAGRKNLDPSTSSGFRLRARTPAKRLNFNPSPRNRSPWDKYREAWYQMACPNEENGPSKIVATRCRDEQPEATLICPLKQLM